jgi:hypothetical protein
LVTFSGGGLLKDTNNVSIAITNAGSFTHTVPAGYSRCRVIVTGSGGSGGNDSDGDATGTGGGAGGTAIAYLRSVPATTYALTVGRSPANATAGTDGVAGSLSSFGSLVTAYGGSKGSEADSALPGGAGGSAVGGAVNISGGSGSARTGATSSALGGSSYWGGPIVPGANPVAAYGAGGNGVWNGLETTGSAGAGIIVIEYY